MIARLRKRLSDLRRRFSRNEWSAHLLRLSKSKSTATEPGLILIQIDGLARNQLLRAIEKGRMPFLRRLIHREEYEPLPFYSGLPSSTPAVQGEIFYGVKTVVPSFSFRDHHTGRDTFMYHAESVQAIEEKLRHHGAGLLTGGSAYSDIYTGGANESHFCAAQLGWNHFIHKANFFGAIGVCLFYSPIILRIAALMAIEFGLAIYDGVRGIATGRHLLKEVQFIPTRVAICVLLRELITIGVRIDTARGLPIIHANFLGYDEQSHRRGPSSAFAHWTLKGIDRAIHDIWKTSKRSTRRNYDLWVYSDHGQEHTQPYVDRTGRTLEATVEETLRNEGLLERAPLMAQQNGIQLKRVGWLGQSFQWLMSDPVKSSASLDIPAMGPIGHLYLSGRTSREKVGRVAEALVQKGGVPAVYLATEGHTVKVWMPDGEFELPGDAAKVLGEDHPFLAEVTQDMIALVHHPNSGKLVLSGWEPKMERSVTFALENGSHAGPGREETQGFAMLPSDAPITLRLGEFIRPVDLAECARRLLSRTERHRPFRLVRKRHRNTLRVMTYNVHSCLGMDGRISPERIARIISKYSPDVVALQEVDVAYPRTGGVDQAHAIAKDLEMEFHFHPAYRLQEEQYGDAILSSLPIKLVKAGPLPGIPRLEPRGALWVTITFNGRKLHFINTHAGLRRREKIMQIEALLGPEWLGHPDCATPAILCGDFNTLPISRQYRKITKTMLDVQATLENHRLRGTWLGLWRLDHVFITPDIEVVGINVPQNTLTRVASDHLPLIVDITF